MSTTKLKFKKGELFKTKSVDLGIDLCEPDIFLEEKKDFTYIKENVIGIVLSDIVTDIIKGDNCKYYFCCVDGYVGKVYVYFMEKISCANIN